MKIKTLTKAIVATAGLALGSLAFAATGGGATIHNSATLTYGGGLKVSAKVDVRVRTVAVAPTMETLTTLPVQAVAGQQVNIEYRITSNSNGFDAYVMQLGQVSNGASDGTYSIVPSAQVNLNASITIGDAAPGIIYIPAGSGKDFDGSSGDQLSAGDIVYVNGGYYKITAVTEGTIANTNLATNTLNNEVPTTVELEPAILTDANYPYAPAITQANTPAGTQIGEVKVITVEFTAGNPDVLGTDGTYDLTLQGTTSATDGAGTVVSFDNGGETNAVTVLSGAAELVKEARNKTTGGSFATTGVTAKAGDIIEYRLTVSPVGASAVTGAKLTDILSGYVTYVANTTTLNGQVVADGSGAELFPLHTSLGGLEVTGVDNAAVPNATPGSIDVGETAVVIFEVEVQ